jgi:hypothetical protein
MLSGIANQVNERNSNPTWLKASRRTHHFH